MCVWVLLGILKLGVHNCKVQCNSCKAFVYVLQGEKLGFPLSIMVWCSTLCGGSKKKRGDASMEREMVPDHEEGEEYSSEFLASTADEYAAALDEASNKLEEAVAEKEKRNA